jgi:single-stranded DNA-binding protein
MNSCILMAEVIQDPQLRFTPDNQTPIAELWVQFAGLREDEPPAKLKVVGWGNLAQEIQERYHVGDKVIIEGRLHMNTVERQEGFKEKRAELTAQKIYLLGADASLSVTASMPASSPAAKSTSVNEAPASKPTNKPPASKPPAAKVPAYSAPPAAEPVDYDEIPF